MSVGTSHQFLPQWVDARKLAHHGLVLSGEMSLDRLGRFEKAIVQSITPLLAEVRFDIDSSKHRIVSGTIKGEVSIICQRCLQPMPFTINTVVSFGIVGTEEAVKQLPKDLEPWLIESEDGTADLYQMLEDELLLVLPMVGYHDEQCVDKALYSSGKEVETNEHLAPSKKNPFSVLEALKDSKKN